MYQQWKIKVSDVAYRLNRDDTCESAEIIRTAEDCGYTEIKISDDTIEGIDPDGYSSCVAELG